MFVVVLLDGHFKKKNCSFLFSMWYLLNITVSLFLMNIFTLVHCVHYCKFVILEKRKKERSFNKSKLESTRTQLISLKMANFQSGFDFISSYCEGQFSIDKYQSKRTGMKFYHVKVPASLNKVEICVQTRPDDDTGCAHTLGKSKFLFDDFKSRTFGKRKLVKCWH